MITFYRSLRFRVATMFVLLSVSINSSLTLALRISREQSLLGALDARLGRMSASLSTYIEEEGIDAISANRITSAWKSGVSADSWFVQVRDPNQRVVASNSSLGAIQLPESVWNKFDADNHGSVSKPHSPRTIVIPGGVLSTQDGTQSSERARAGLIHVKTASDQTYHVLFGVSMAVADNLTEALERTLFMTACGATVAAGLAGWVVASLLARRVRTITEAMQAVTPKAMSAGLKIPEGTDEIGQVGVELNTMLAGLERAFRSQERFISDVSHELKTPLAALLTEAQVLHSGTPTEADFRAFVTSTEDEVRRLGNLVESFLMLTRFDHGKRFVADGVVPINDVVLDAIRHSQVFARQKNISVQLTIHDGADECNEGLVRGDFDLLRVAVDNIVRNAVQISKPGDSVEVAVECAGGRMTVSVRDFGPGLHPDYIDRIFERFYQAPTRESGSRGTGLGLAISKAIVDLHRGTIQAMNHVGGGCVFVILLPLASDPVWNDTTADPQS